LHVRAEYSQTRETNGLDNFALVAPCTNDIVRLDIRQVSPGVVRLEWPVSAVCWQLELSDHCTADAATWRPAVSEPGHVVMPDGEQNTVTVTPPPGRTRFYRLSKQ
jgi:hypothetical protein